jgi:hypothetical protein
LNNSSPWEALVDTEVQATVDVWVGVDAVRKTTMRWHWMHQAKFCSIGHCRRMSNTCGS